MTIRQIVSWIVPLIGHQFDLEDFPFWLAGQDIRIVERDDSFVLVIPVAIVGINPEPVLPFARAHLELLNGIGRVLSSSFRQLSIADKLFGVDAAGAVVSTVVPVGCAEMRGKAGALGVVVGGEVQPDPREGVALPLLRAAMRSPRAHDALVIVGRPNLTWSELYLLFELVQADIGGQIFDLGWISRRDAKLFSQTANSYSSLRSAGRHGKDRGDPPPLPMQHHVAVGLVRNLVLAWLLLPRRA